MAIFGRYQSSDPRVRAQEQRTLGSALGLGAGFNPRQRRAMTQAAMGGTIDQYLAQHQGQAQRLGRAVGRAQVTGNPNLQAALERLQLPTLRGTAATAATGSRMATETRQRMGASQQAFGLGLGYTPGQRQMLRQAVATNNLSAAAPLFRRAWNNNQAPALAAKLGISPDQIHSIL